jgi:hypothetical protein
VNGTQGCCTSREEKTARAIDCGRCRDITIRVEINLVHGSRLLYPVREVVLVLQDTKRIDPDIGHTEPSSNNDSILESFGQIVFGYPQPESFKVGPEQLNEWYFTPAMTEGDIGTDWRCIRGACETYCVSCSNVKESSRIPRAFRCGRLLTS